MQAVSLVWKPLAGLPMNSPQPSYRPVRSYVVRSGRLTDSQRRALDAHWPEYGIDYQPCVLPWAQHFGQQQPLTVEIGFGMGDSLLTMARAQPEHNFLGIEVHKPGLGKLMRGAKQAGLGNLKLMCHDAVEVLEHCFGQQTIDRLLVLFPDPWPKQRHHKRRIVQPAFVALVTDRLKSGGYLHLATDWQPYAGQMLQLLEQEPRLRNCAGQGRFCPEPRRPATRFEQRGKRLGHGVWDLVFEKCRDRVVSDAR